MTVEILRRARFPTPLDREAVAAAWRDRGFSCHSFVDPPGQEWLDFVHGCNELVTVAEGRLRLEIAGQCVEAGPGDEVFIPRSARHSVTNVHRGTTIWLFGYD